MKIWNSLKDDIAKSGSIEILLFDSGSGEITKATIDDVLLPIDADASGSPPLPDADTDLVPGYYRKSVFSRAWMRMTNIGARVSPFYGVYAYAEHPPLPRINLKQLERLRGKAIVDREELAAMDTTIWQIVVAKSDADKSHFLAPSLRVVDALSADPIPLKGNLILHITDLHFDERDPGKSQHVWDPKNPMHEAIILGLGAKKDSIGLILATGDFTFQATEAEFNQAKHSLSSLVGSCGLGPEHVVICPGNHDIRWTKAEEDAFENGRPQEISDGSKEEYVKFYRWLLQHDPSPDLSMARRFVLPHGRVLDICSLNSTTLAAGKSYLPGMGYVGSTAFSKVSRALAWSEQPTPALRMIALHHHLVPAEDVEDPKEFSTGFGMAIDAQKVLREAAKVQVQMVVHGHRHRAFYARAGAYGLPEETASKYALGHVSVVGGGSAGSSAVANKCNFFNLIEIGPSELRSTMYRSKDRAVFEPIKTWSARFAEAEGCLRLGDWIVQS